MTRILLTTDVVGGVWDFCLLLAQRLQAANHSITLLAIGVPTPEQTEAARSVGVELVSAALKLEWMQDSADDVDATRQLVSSVARETHADVIHANQFAAACADVDVPVLLTLHSDVLSWSKWTLGAHDVPTEWRAYAQLVREALRRADHIVAVSRFLADEVRNLYDVHREIEVIYNGWPTGNPSPLATLAVSPRAGRGRREAAGEGYLSAGTPITLVAGRVWDIAKNIPMVAEAARGWNCGPVYLAGESTHPEGGEASAPEPLQPLGFLARDELDAWLGRAAVYVSAARYDPFGLLPLQAALRGCALLLSDIPSYRELWDGAATFFRLNDVDHLRVQWERTLAHPQQQPTAYERARHRFSVEAMAYAYERSYAGLDVRVAA